MTTTKIHKPEEECSYTAQGDLPPRSFVFIFSTIQIHILVIIIVARGIWVASFPDHFKHKVLRANGAHVRLIFLQPKPQDFVFILALTANTTNYPHVVMGLDDSRGLLSAKGTNGRIHIKPLLSLKLCFQLLSLEPGGDRHHVLHFLPGRSILRDGAEAILRVEEG